MTHASKSDRAWSHQFPPPLPQEVDAHKSVVIRYDGVSMGQEKLIWAVMNKDDLAKLPQEVLDGIEFIQRDDEGDLRGNIHAFFVGSERHLSLYVNTEEYPDFISKIRDASSSRGMTPLNSIGDLRNMMGPDLDILPPEIPAFVENGWSHVPSSLAVTHLESVRRQRSEVDDSAPDIF